MDYDQYIPATLFENKLALIPVVLQSLLLDFSPVPNDGLCVDYDQATTKQWLALQQPPFHQLMMWSMINIDQLHHLKICWHSYMWFFSHFDLITNQWQMTADWSNRNKKQQNSGGHCSNRLFMN
jgi:hypothetical protein